MDGYNPSLDVRSIAHYNLLEKIGDGALGAVFRARDTRVGRTVALKVFPADPTASDGCPDALVADARAAAALSHPNLAVLFDVGHADGMCYLAYEFVAGTTLRTAMASGAMNPKRAVELAAQVADALADAEAAGIVHGDVRPDTVAVTGKGAAKLLDIGMARWTRGGAVRRSAAASPEDLPADSAPIVNYLAPEQALGGETDRRADIFSLASMLYEMLTGRSPFAAATPQQALLNVISLTPPPVSSVAPGVPVEADAVLAKGMSKDISQRYDSAAIFSSELRRVAAQLEEATAAKSNGFALPVDDRADRIPLGVLIVGVAVIAAIAVALWWNLR